MKLSLIIFIVGCLRLGFNRLGFQLNNKKLLIKFILTVCFLYNQMNKKIHFLETNFNNIKNKSVDISLIKMAH